MFSEIFFIMVLTSLQAKDTKVVPLAALLFKNRSSCCAISLDVIKTHRVQSNHPEQEIFCRTENNNGVASQKRKLLCL